MDPHGHHSASSFRQSSPFHRQNFCIILVASCSCSCSGPGRLLPILATCFCSSTSPSQLASSLPYSGDLKGSIIRTLVPFRHGRAGIDFQLLLAYRTLSPLPFISSTTRFEPRAADTEQLAREQYSRWGCLTSGTGLLRHRYVNHPTGCCGCVIIETTKYANHFISARIRDLTMSTPHRLRIRRRRWLFWPTDLRRRAFPPPPLLKLYERCRLVPRT